MRKILQYTVGLLLTYLVAWTAAFAYMFFSRGEAAPWDLYWRYFTWAWTFRAGELPGFIWLFSIVAFVPLAVVVVLAIWLHGRLRKHGA